MSIVITTNDRETKVVASLFAKDIVQDLKPGKKATVIALSGNLGTGKTTFAQGFAKGLGVKEKIQSPTFVIMKSYALHKHNLKVKSFLYFYHLDCYRLESHAETKAIGLKEILDNPHNLVLIEWPEKIKKALPKKMISIKFFSLNENKRKISFN